MSERAKEAWAVVATILFIALIGMAVFLSGWDHGKDHGIESMQREAIEHDSAEYDSITGKWRWKNPRRDPIPIPPDPKGPRP